MYQRVNITVRKDNMVLTSRLKAECKTRTQGVHNAHSLTLLTFCLLLLTLLALLTIDFIDILFY